MRSWPQEMSNICECGMAKSYGNERREAIPFCSWGSPTIIPSHERCKNGGFCTATRACSQSFLMSGIVGACRPSTVTRFSVPLRPTGRVQKQMILALSNVSATRREVVKKVRWLSHHAGESRRDMFRRTARQPIAGVPERDQQRT